MQPFRALWNILADGIWPRTCAVPTCSRLSDRADRHICSRCFAALPFHEAGGACEICGALVSAETTHAFVCEACRAKRPAFERARSALVYEGAVEQLVQTFKFRHGTWLTDDFADLLEGTARARLAAAEIDVVVPVPLHPNRERQRGYNQCALLAEALAARLDRRADCASFARVRDTPKQSRLSEEERKKNLKPEDFAVTRPAWLRGRTVLLLDDVMTSGRTLSICSQVLLAAGASRVWALTLARALRRA